jgi:hypothetical protein
MDVHQLAIRCCIAVALLSPCSAAAQDWNQPWSDPRDRPPRVDFSVSAGLVSPTDWSDLVVLGTISPISGVLEQVLVRDLRIEPDNVFGGAVTYWQDRYGFRAHGAFSRSSIVAGSTLPTGGEEAEFRTAGVDSYFYDVRGAIGLVKYSPSRRLLPYVFVGFGGITYDLDRTLTPPLLSFIQRGAVRSRVDNDIVIVEDDGREFILSIDELGLETVFAVNFGVGTDIRIPLGGAGVGLRLELSDHISPSPLGLRIRELGPAGGLNSDSAVHFGTVHHLRMSAGLVLQVGR